MLVRLLVLLILGCGVRVEAQTRPENVFFIGEKERPQRIVVTVGDTLSSPPPAATSAMVGLLNGVVADLSGAELSQFLATPMPRTKLVDARGNLERIGVAHVIGKSTVKRVELFSGNEGVFIAQEMESDAADSSPRVSKLDPSRFRAVLMGWPRYRGEIVEDAKSEERSKTPAGQLVELEKPYSQAPVYFDEETLGARFTRGGKSQIEPVKRVLSDETMYVRLPKGYDVKRPAGLLVWIHADIDGRLPQVFEGVLDELGIVGVGVRDVGNQRPPADRFQLALDAVWTVSRRHHIDAARVYVTGLSGGGRIASRLVMCLPDFFMGGMPIVGMDAYFNIPVGNGRHLPGRFKRPEGKIWALTKTRRVGAITGDRDGNAVGIREAAKQMAVDGMAIHVFDYKGLAHTMPSAAQVREALMWIDEPYREEQAKAQEAARAAMTKYTQKYGKRAPADEKQRRELVKVTEMGAWTAAAWEAVELLKMGERK